jgi:hypothetical protein
MSRIATADTDPADVLRPYTVTATARREARMCSVNRHPLEPGTSAFLDGDGLTVCAGCARHCTTCTDEECDHPRYAYAAPASELPGASS